MLVSLNVYWPWRHRTCDGCGLLHDKKTMQRTVVVTMKDIVHDKVVRDLVPVVKQWLCKRCYRHPLLLNEQFKAKYYKRVVVGMDIFTPVD